MKFEFIIIISHAGELQTKRFCKTSHLSFEASKPIFVRPTVVTFGSLAASLSPRLRL